MEGWRERGERRCDYQKFQRDNYFKVYPTAWDVPENICIGLESTVGKSGERRRWSEGERERKERGREGEGEGRREGKREGECMGVGVREREREVGWEVIVLRFLTHFRVICKC